MTGQAVIHSGSSRRGVNLIAASSPYDFRHVLSSNPAAGQDLDTSPCSIEELRNSCHPAEGAGCAAAGEDAPKAKRDQSFQCIERIVREIECTMEGHSPVGQGYQPTAGHLIDFTRSIERAKTSPSAPAARNVAASSRIDAASRSL